MKVLLVGSGGREHAIAWNISKSPIISKLYCAPSNPGINAVAEPVDIKVNDIDSLAKFALDNSIDLTIVGPELPLSLGISGEFKKLNLNIFGPVKKAAMLETSKSFAKEFMTKYSIPTANYKVFDKLNDAAKYLYSAKYPVVVKYDGLAGGKGVTVCHDMSSAMNVIINLLQKNDSKVVIEEFLSGRETSIIAICDGKKSLILPPAQDYKLAFDNNTGPNTGGMGSYAPVNRLSQATIEKIKTDIIDKTITGLINEGIEYRGVLYAGLMIDSNDNINLLEYNCRFGDPETQVIVPLVEDDLLDIFYQAAIGDIKPDKIKINNYNCVCVVLCSEGYPDDYKIDYEIFGIDEKLTDDNMIFYAGVKESIDKKLVTSCGRVLNIIGIDKNLDEARKKAYQLVEKIHFKGKFFRSDIASYFL